MYDTQNENPPLGCPSMPGLKFAFSALQLGVDSTGTHDSFSENAASISPSGSTNETAAQSGTVVPGVTVNVLGP
ncbi:MAG: hypothetical protein U0610_33015 [bacterium]